MKPETVAFLAKADTALDKARRILAIEIHDEAGRLAYFAQFQAAQAAIFEAADKIVKTHNGVIAEFHRVAPDLRVPPDLASSLSTAYRYKEIADYGIGDGLTVTPERAMRAVRVAETFVATVRERLQGSVG
ncbi:HEPN domain-containing protein [Methylobacterium sp. JK268]